MTFTPPIVLPADHYFFRPEIQVAGGDFLYLSAPKPIVAPGTPFRGCQEITSHFATPRGWTV
jgi:hypothetical protein